MSKFYAVSTQAKELCNKAKTTKEKSKKLTNEVILKKGEVIRLTNEAFSFTRNWVEAKKWSGGAQGKLH